MTRVSIALVVAFLPLACDRSPSESASSASTSASARPSVFAEVAKEIGIDFEVTRPAGKEYLMPESMGPGAALFDFDGDGDLDLYLVNGVRRADGDWSSEGGGNRLYRQDSGGRFVDVTAAARVGDRGYGMGAAMGDTDNDGDLDLYVTNYGRDVFYANLGDGTFRDETDRAGIRGEVWSTSAGFFDFDVDGHLDLYVTHYVAFDPKVRGKDSGGRPEYPAPSLFPGTPDTLYRNLGGGTFEDVSETAGIAKAGKGLGVVFIDLNGDDRVDIYVANDGEPNFAWIQTPEARFVDQALPFGLALNGYGQPEAGMGIALGDTRGQGTLDLLVTHLVQESNTLYRQISPQMFEDATAKSGLSQPSIDVTAFGAAFFDLDLDGDLDLLTANGRVMRGLPHPRARLTGHWRPYAEPNQIFLNQGRGRFQELKQDPFGDRVEVSRGLAVGDLDEDGDLDVVVTNGNGTVAIYRNVAPRAGHWLTVRAIDREIRRDAYGARVMVRVGDRRWIRPVTATYSYLASHDSRAHFGLGSAAAVDAIEVVWPGGDREQFPGCPTDQLQVVERGRGTKVR